MREVAARVRFLAVDVLALLEVAAEQKLDELWLVRGVDCFIRTPDDQLRVKPVLVEGDPQLVQDLRASPRVEVLELHNHVLRTLRSAGVTDRKGTFVEVCFTQEGEFCLILCCDSPRKITGGKAYRWMTDLFTRRMF